MDIRSNASLKAVATAAKSQANYLCSMWFDLEDAAKNPQNHADSWEIRCRARNMFDHYQDVKLLAAHLERLAN